MAYVKEELTWPALSVASSVTKQQEEHSFTPKLAQEFRDYRKKINSFNF